MVTKRGVIEYRFFNSLDFVCFYNCKIVSIAFGINMNLTLSWNSALIFKNGESVSFGKGYIQKGSFF